MKDGFLPAAMAGSLPITAEDQLTNTKGKATVTISGTVDTKRIFLNYQLNTSYIKIIQTHLTQLQLLDTIPFHLYPK